jgi:hypothetical protein
MTAGEIREMLTRNVASLDRTEAHSGVRRARTL